MCVSTVTTVVQKSPKFVSRSCCKATLRFLVALHVRIEKPPHPVDATTKFILTVVISAVTCVNRQ